jgi:transcriptional regulator with XRE-family HTH domain
MRGRLFGDRLREIRVKNNLTVDVMARSVGTHKGYISGIENGQVNAPSAKMIRKVARKYKEDLKELLILAWLDKAPQEIRADLMEKLLLRNS